LTLVKNGTGTQVLTGNNTYTGPTIVNSGTLQIGTGGANGSIASTSEVKGSAGTLVVDLNLSGTFGKNISGGVAITQAGTGTLTLTGTNTTNGLTSVTSTGTLIANAGLGGGAAVSGSGALTVNGGIGGNATVTSTGTLSASGNIGGSASVTGGGTIIASGGITGDATVANGTLSGLANIGHNATIGTGAGAASSSVLSLVSGTTTTLSVGNNLTLNADAVFHLNLNSDTAQTTPACDILSVPGVLTLNNAVLSGSDLGSTTLSNEESFTLVIPVGGISGTGFSNPSLVIGTSVFNVFYWNGIDQVSPPSDGQGIWATSITLVAVPEPQTWAMMLGGLGVLGFWQSRPGRGRRNS
jgi:fibronectin-binding autotransporter adhesin